MGNGKRQKLLAKEERNAKERQRAEQKKSKAMEYKLLLSGASVTQPSQPTPSQVAARPTPSQVAAQDNNAVKVETCVCHTDNSCVKLIRNKLTAKVECNVCGALYSSLSDLTKHTGICHSQYNYGCPDCRKVFMSAGELGNHKCTE